MKKFISLLVAFAMTLNFFCVQVAAAGESMGGDYPETGTPIFEWSFSNGTLTVMGKRPNTLMPDFDSPDDVPWAHLREQITQISIGAMASIGRYAFYGCTSLTQLPNLPSRSSGVNGSGVVGEYAFAGCTSITNVQIQNAVSEIRSHAFEGCTGITNVTMDLFNDAKLDNEVFKDCTSLKTVKFGVSLGKATVTEMGAGVFENCVSLEEISIGSGTTGIKNIGENTFKNCSNLTAFDFPGTVTSIDHNAFSGSGIIEIKIPSAVTAIGIGAFENCSNLTKVSIPNNITEINDYAFANDASLTEINIGSNITRIGKHAFTATGISKVDIPYDPSKNIEIGDQAFSSCLNITQVILPPNAKQVGSGAFSSCVALKSLFIPSDAVIGYEGNVVSDSTYLIKYEPDTSNPSDPIAKITSIENGVDGGADIPVYLTFNEGTANEVKLRVSEVAEASQVKVSQNHSHIPKLDNTDGKYYCTLCGRECGESRGTTWSIEDTTNTLIISSVETAPADIRGRMDLYKKDDDDTTANAVERPWDDPTVTVEALEIREGVVYIGDYAFRGLSIPKIEIPSTVELIGKGAFSNITDIQGISDDNPTRFVFIPPSVGDIYDNVFEGTDLDLILYPQSYMLGKLPEDAVKALYTVDEASRKIKITDVQPKDYPGFYQYPAQVFIKGIPYDIIADDCNHKFSGEYGVCDICKRIVGGNMGMPDVAGGAATAAVTWYWYPDTNTVYIRTDKTLQPDGSPTFNEFEIIDYDTLDHKNPFDRLMNEEKARIDHLVFEGDNITYIGKYAFKNLINITEINLPSSLTYIGSNAFEDCRAVTKLTIPNGVKTIDDRAFYNVNFNGNGERTFVEIPESVTTVGEQVFAGCSGLNYIAYPNTPALANMFSATITNDDGTTTTVNDIIPQAFKIAYNTLKDDPTKVEVTEIRPGREGTLLSMPEQICGKDVRRVDENYHDLVNKDACIHKYKDETTNKCPVCGKILGDASEGKDGSIEWTITDGILKLWCTNPEVGATMKDFTLSDNPPWQNFMISIRGIEIGEGIRNIGDYAFTGAYNVTSVQYPSTLKRIGDHAFERCGRYTDIIIPDSVEELGNDVFYHCSFISGGGTLGSPQRLFITLNRALYERYSKTFFIPDNDPANEQIKTKAVIMLTEDINGQRLITGAVLTNGYSRDQIKSYERHYEIAKIHTHCFNDENICILCGGIGGYCGPEGSEEETMWVLEGDGALTISGNITGAGRIGSSPWMEHYKDSIKSIYIEKNVTSIGVVKDPANPLANRTAAFRDCNALTSVTFETGSQLTAIEASSFESCENLVKIEIPQTVLTIGEDAFNGCGISGRMIIPANIRSIGENSFNNCPALTALMIPEEFASDYQSGALVINLSNPNAAVLVYSNDGTTVKGISVPSASSDVNLEIPSQIIPGISVTRIEGEYNGNVKNISSVTLPATITVIGSRAFAGFGDTTLTGTDANNNPQYKRPFNVNIPSGVTSIGVSAFADSAVTNVTIPDGVTRIPDNAFNGCSLLRSVTLPKGITEIGEGAFASCIDLTSINKTGTVDLRDTALRFLGDGAFSGCSDIIKIVLPASIENVINANAFYGCNSLRILEIPEVNSTGENICSGVVSYFKSGSLTSVIVYRWIAGAEDGGAYRITSAVLGDEANWGGAITSDNGRVDDWLIVWSGHEHCYNSSRQCVLCKEQGGMCGTTATWSYDSNSYRITINRGYNEDGTPGDGVMWDMMDHEPDATDTSEAAEHYREMWGSLKGEIREVVINEGVVNIGDNAFRDCPELVTVHIPSTVETIGSSAFEFSLANDQRSMLKIVYIADNSNLKVIEANAFKNNVRLTNIGDETNAKLPEKLSYIRDGAFEGCSSLSEIIIPDEVVVIGSRAFANCSGLGYAKLPLRLSNFGDNAFLNCVSLTEIVVSPGVENGGNGIFSGCRNLIFAVVPNNFADGNFDNPDNVTRVKYILSDKGNLLSDREISEVRPVPGTPVTIPDYIMGAPVTVIGIKAFKPSTALDVTPSAVNLPSTLRRINDFAFEGCTWLRALDLTVAENLNFIGTEAFEGCTSLTEMVIPDTVTDLGMRAFHMCNKLETVKLSGSLKELKEGTFEGCSALKYIVVPEGVTSIANKNFADCTSLEYVVLPFSMRNGSLNFGAFDNCTGMAAIYVPTAENIDYANNYNDGAAIISEAEVIENKLRIAVYDQHKEVYKVIDGTAVAGRSTSYETVLNIPPELTVREVPPHQHCFNIHNQCIICGDRGGQCGPHAWWTLDADGNLRIYPETDEFGRIIESTIDHDSAEYFGTWSEFKDRIYTVTVEEGITLIDSGAFEHCLRLQTVKLPNSLEYLQDYAFSDCISLIEIDLPDGIISLGEGVFMDDINLKNVELPKSISELPKDTFKGCRALESIKLPSDLRYVREGAFSGCINLRSIELPVDTRTVSEDAFSDCTNLTYIVAPDACRYIFNETEFPNATYFKYAPEGIGVKITYARPGANVHHLVIPNTIAGLPVVAIGDDAFIPRPNGYAAVQADGADEQGLVSITIDAASQMTEIGNNAFKNRTDLQKVYVKSNNIVKIGKSAFEGCTALDYIELPSSGAVGSVREIGERAFYGCTSLPIIPLWEGLKTIGSEAFAHTGFNRFNIIPSTVTSMGANVFGNVSGDALIAIPVALAKHYDDSYAGNSGSYAFRSDDCGYVVYRVDGNGKKWVVEGKLGKGKSTIIGFEDYMEVDPDHVHCYPEAGGGCVLCNLAGGTCGADPDGTNAEWYIDRTNGTLYIKGQGALQDFRDTAAPWSVYNELIKKIDIGEGINNISTNAFIGCYNAESAVIPSTVRRIGENAFMDNKSLVTVTIPDGVEEIPAGAFSGCSNLREIKLPGSLKRIEARAFADAAIKYVELPAAGHEIFIDNAAFEGTNLEYIAMPERTVITAEAQTTPYNRFTYRIEPNNSSVRIVLAQLGSTSGSKLNFPSLVGGKPVTAIGGPSGETGGHANVVGGNNISNIRIVTIPDGVTEIYDYAFQGCVNLAELTLPDTLETIGKEAFSGCGSYTRPLVFNSGLKSIGEKAFSDCGGLTIVKLPLSIENIGNGAFSGCGKLDIIATPEKVGVDHGYTNTASRVQYERRADGNDYIAAASLGDGKTTIDRDKLESVRVYLDVNNHDHCYYQGVCVLCNDAGGRCGSGLTWNVNGDVLVIEPVTGNQAQADNLTGEMDDFTASNPAPWLEQYKDIIRKVIIREGVVSIGNNAFSGLSNLSDISEAFPGSVTRIGENAFATCAKLVGNARNGKTLELDVNIRDVAATAFAGCSSFESIILPDSTAAALNVPNDTAVIKYRVSGTNAQITKIELTEGKQTDVPNVILGKYTVIGVDKNYRKYVATGTHTHYHEGNDNRCTICGMISGECGDNVYWYIDEDNRILVIHGKDGAIDNRMYDYGGNNNAPWTQYAAGGENLFDNIFIREPVSYIGSNAFVDLGRFDEITLPPSVTGLGENVFAGTAVRRMYIPSGLNQNDRNKLDSSIEKVYYQVTEDRAWVDVTRIELPEGVSKISIPRTIYHIPVRSVAENYRQYVEQDDGHEHDYGDEHGESECRICGKVSYNHIWEDGWNHNGDSHWHDCERGDYDPIKDGNIDGSGYGDHDWKEVDRKAPTATEDGWVRYECFCGAEKTEVLPKTGSNTPGNPSNPGNPGGSFDSPGTSGGSTTNPPPTGNNGGDNSGGSGGNGGSGNNGGGSNYIPQPWETTSPDKPPVTNPPSVNLPDVSDFNGDFTFNIEQGGDSMPAKIVNSTSDIIKAVLSEEEQNKLINGNSNVQIILTVTKGDGTVSLRDRAVISAALGEYKLGEYMDISLYKVVDGVREKITRTSAPLTITIDIPASLMNSGRRFRVIRAHDGSAAVLRDLDNTAGTVTISTDRFSPYAIAYTDSVNVSDDYDPPMPTGDPGISVFVFVTMASGLTAVGMVYFNHASEVAVDEERRKKIAKLIAFGKKGKIRKVIAIGLIFIVTLYYQGLEGIQGSKKEKSEV